MPGRRWTKEQRAELSTAIHRWKPWDCATGPRTPEGKARSARNALKHGVRSQVVKNFRRVVWENRRFGLFDFKAQEKIEAALEAAIQFVASLMDKGDVDSLISGQEFIDTQTKKATRKIWRVHDRLVQLARWDLYSLRSPKVKS